jgi:GH24 family phage-related lysozyme (muramidase)
MSAINRAPIFQAVKALRKGQGFTLAEVRVLDAAIDAAIRDTRIDPPVTITPPASTGRQVSQRGIDLIHSFEQCRLDAYPDPGSRDGNPWTIGWGSTGPGIQRGTRWTQAQCDERFRQDLAKFAAKVDALLGTTKTTQHQFDAMVSLAYNIGVGALAKSTVLRKHKAGDHVGAARAFLMWNKNDGKEMRGLTRRRLAEADLYDD